MGYSHGRKLTDDMVVKEIKDVMKNLGIDRMPSRNEIELSTQNSSLTNRISRTGGFYLWADKLGLEKKESETLTSYGYEQKCFEYLSSTGYTELTTIKFPYDLLYEKCCKIDVKVSKAVYLRGSKAFSFNLEYRQQKSDFYVCYCVDDENEKTLIIPAHIMYGKNQLCIGLKSMYDKYIDRWDHIYKYAEIIKAEF